MGEHGCDVFCGNHDDDGGVDDVEYVEDGDDDEDHLLLEPVCEPPCRSPVGRFSTELPNNLMMIMLTVVPEHSP